jgi:alpha-D-xyloside xylohydrolase
MRQSNKIIWIVMVSVCWMLGCSGIPKSELTIQLEANKPVIRFRNPGGDPIVLKGKGEAGAIGYQLSGKWTWIQDVPEQMSGENEITYSWKTDHGQVVMKTQSIGDDIHLYLSLQNPSGDPPEKWMIHIQADSDEYFTGIFERVIDGPQTDSWREGIKTGLNLHGERVEMKLKPTVSAYAPFFISSNHYGLFVRGTWPGWFDFCKTNPDQVEVEFEGSEFKLILYRDPSVAQIVCRHAREAGPSVIPPKWAHGPWRWRDNHFNRESYYDGTPVHAPFNSDLVEDILMMQAYGIPCTAYWIDRPWAQGIRGFDDYEFDPERFPHAQEMIHWVNDKQMEMMIWIAPFVMGKMADVAEENGYFLKSRTRGNTRQILMDFTNAEACQWWSESGPAKLAKMGIKGFKLDRADGEKLLDSLNLTTSAGTSYRENYNDYPVQYVRTAYEAVKPVLGDDFILFPRAQYTGSSRYGAMWSGDPWGTPEGLRSVIIGLQRCAVMGYPLWASDTGGYGRRFNRETCMRWLGFSCFSSVMEVGPNVDRGFWNSPDEPSYDAELIAAWRLYALTRMKLIDLIHELAVESHETGLPIVRPLFLHYPGQLEAWKDWQTYLFGPDILVSAIWEKGKTRHALYLPAGEKWIDAWDQAVYRGGTTIEVDAPMYKIPLFIRKGANIDLGNLNEIYQESLEIAKIRPNLAGLEKREGWN